MKKSTQPKPPGHLSRAAKVWWLKVAEEYAISDSGGILLLNAAAEAWDRAQSAREQISADGGPMLADRFGQQKVHPLCAVERDARAQHLAALKQLNLDVEPLRDRPGRPAGVGVDWRGSLK